MNTTTNPHSFSPVVTPEAIYTTESDYKSYLDLVYYTAHKSYTGQVLKSKQRAIATPCGLIANTFPFMECVKINYKRRFLRMRTPMNAFIAVCRQLRNDNVRKRKAKLFIISFYFYKKGFGKLKGQ